MFSAVLRASGPVFMFCALRLIFLRYRGRRVPISRTTRPDSFSAIPRVSGPVFMFCPPGLIFGGIEGFGSLFHVFRYMTCFRRYRGRRVPFSCFALWTSFRRYRRRQVPFSCFALPDSFSALPRTSRPVFMFSDTIYVFGGTKGVGSRFHVLRSRTRFRRNRGCRVPFSCFARPDSLLAVSRASGHIFFWALGHFFSGIEGVGFRFHISHFRTRFRWFRGRRIPFSCFARTDYFSAEQRASNLVLMFFVHGHVFGDTEGVRSRFHIFSAPGHVFGCTEGVGSRFHVLRS
jgi:hypothetical protein